MKPHQSGQTRWDILRPRIVTLDGIKRGKPDLSLSPSVENTFVKTNAVPDALLNFKNPLLKRPKRPTPLSPSRHKFNIIWQFSKSINNTFIFDFSLFAIIGGNACNTGNVTGNVTGNIYKPRVYWTCHFSQHFVTTWFRLWLNRADTFCNHSVTSTSLVFIELLRFSQVAMLWSGNILQLSAVVFWLFLTGILVVFDWYLKTRKPRQIWLYTIDLITFYTSRKISFIRT